MIRRITLLLFVLLSVGGVFAGFPDIIKDIDNIIGSPKDSDEVFYDKLSSVDDYLRNS